MFFSRAVRAVQSVQSGHVVVGLSGGVDSAVSALLLLRQGFRVSCVFAQSWDGRDETGQCAGEEDWRAAQAVAGQLGVEVTRKPFVSEYWCDVFEPMLRDYRSGVTPNPDVLCNRAIKFAHLRNFALQHLQADYFATGHYARLAPHPTTGKPQLLRALSPKDQTFFLCQLGSDQLERVMFPVGHLTKEEVRAIAREAGLENADRRGSRGICFVGKRDFGDFLSEYVPMTQGYFVDMEGIVMGIHGGAERYTIGQRVRLGGQSERYFVVAKVPNVNGFCDVLVATSRTHDALMYSSLEAEDVVWIAGEPPVGTQIRVTCRYRHTPGLTDAVITPVGNSKFELQF